MLFLHAFLLRFSLFFTFCSRSCAFSNQLATWLLLQQRTLAIDQFTDWQAPKWPNFLCLDSLPLEIVIHVFMSQWRIQAEAREARATPQKKKREEETRRSSARRAEKRSLRRYRRRSRQMQTDPSRELTENHKVKEHIGHGQVDR